MLILFSQESLKNQIEKDENRNNFQENVLYNSQYRELIALVNYQREKISSQQTDLTKVLFLFKIAMYHLKITMFSIFSTMQK